MTMENSLFVLSILKKFPADWRPYDDGHIIEEVDRYYEEVLDKWKDYGSDLLDIEQSDACNYFKDYFMEVEDMNFRIREFINDMAR